MGRTWKDRWGCAVKLEWGPLCGAIRATAVFISLHSYARRAAEMDSCRFYRHPRRKCVGLKFHPIDGLTPQKQQISFLWSQPGWLTFCEPFFLLFWDLCFCWIQFFTASLRLLILGNIEMMRSDEQKWHLPKFPWSPRCWWIYLVFREQWVVQTSLRTAGLCSTLLPHHHPHGCCGFLVGSAGVSCSSL